MVTYSMRRHFYIWLFLFFPAFLLLSCSEKNNDEYLHLKLISQYPVDIPGISDLSSCKNENEFLAVSDTIGKVYVISTTGDVIRTLSYTGEDLEGVTYVSTDSTIFVLEEKKKDVVKLDDNGNEILSFPVVVNNIFKKHGPEGITFNPVNEHLYIVNEKFPSLLIEMTLSGEVVDSSELTFAMDYSAVYFDPLDNSLWILSEESELLAKCDLSGIPVEIYRTGVIKGEGLIVDSGNSRIYIMSEHTNLLYLFSTP
jgi:uncharacterized protein YjiK